MMVMSASVLRLQVLRGSQAGLSGVEQLQEYRGRMSLALGAFPSGGGALGIALLALLAADSELCGREPALVQQLAFWVPLFLFLFLFCFLSIPSLSSYSFHSLSLFQ